MDTKQKCMNESPPEVHLRKGRMVLGLLSEARFLWFSSITSLYSDAGDSWRRSNAHSSW